MATLMDLSVPAPDPGPADWNDEGVVYLPGLLPDDLIEAYEAEWQDANGFMGTSAPADGQWSDTPAASPAELWVLDAKEPGGWPDCTPYMRHPALRAICTYQPLADALREAVGEPMGVHLNLTGWVSTRRNWHQDGYLNPEYVADSYAAVWMALGDVHPDSGVFEYVPGSHRWHRLIRQLIAQHVDTSDPAWPQHTEAILTELVEAEIVERNAAVVRYAPERGDVLLWHPRLYHRGTEPMVPNAYRPALIAHYSGIYHRPDMPAPQQVASGGWLFPIQESGPVR
jgi:ectoine hydroxylase-related dioxygenase (phytanoyl-CoA dioxygenase family)